MIGLIDPVSRRPLVADTPHSLTDGTARWPVAAGIPFLRTGRDALRGEALGALDAGDETAALVLLLADQDDYAPLPPPSDAAVAALLGAPDVTFREAMTALEFGPVADYFAHRWSAPTFLSGLALTALHAPRGVPIVEVCCGTGQLLREFTARGFTTIGVDLVFAKVWLGRRFLRLDRLVCAEAATLPLDVPSGATVLNHDALYFFADAEKGAVVAAMARVANGGALLAGHCHVAGHPPRRRALPSPQRGGLGGTAATRGDVRRCRHDGLVRHDGGVRPAGTRGRSRCSGLPRRGSEAGASDAGVGGPGARTDGQPVARDGRQRRPRPDVALPDVRTRICRCVLPLGARPRSRCSAADGDPARAADPRAAARAVVSMAHDPNTLVGWGVVGCGWVARDFAIPAIRAAGRLVAVYDADPTAGCGLRARRAAALEDLVSDPAVEAVYVATPNHAHLGPVLAAAAAGKAVLCEKPIAATRADADAVVDACRRAAVPYATAFDQRFHAAHRALRALVSDGSLGTITQATIRYACWLPADWAADNWRVDPVRAGGGAVLDLAPHGIDLIASLTGADPVAIEVMLQRRVHRYAVDDGGVLAVRYAGDIVATLSVAYNCPDALPRRRLELVGTRACAIAIDTMGQTAGGTLTLHGADGTMRAVPLADDRSPFEVQIEAFGAHVRGAPFPSTPERDLAAFHLLGDALDRANLKETVPCR